MADIASAEATGAVTRGLKILLRLEGLTLFAGMTLLYAVWGGYWWIYVIVFLVPDLSFAAIWPARGSVRSSITPRTATWRR
jgi:uncharacterized protein DUF4260